MSDNFIPLYDLESLNEQQRTEYLKAVCKHMGVPDNLNLVALVHIDEGEGPAHLVAYAKRGATENVRNNLKIDVTSLTNQMINGSIVFTATAKSGSGRQEIATGSKYIENLTGVQLDDALMTASTRALRRVTLQFIGAGVLDESEIDKRKTVNTPATPQLIAPEPTVKPNAEPGKDITPAPGYNVIPQELIDAGNAITQRAIETMKPLVDAAQKEFEANQAKLRADAIAALNVKPAEATPAKRKGRPPKAKVDLGPSSPVDVPNDNFDGLRREPAQADIKAAVTAPVTPPTPTPVSVTPIPRADIIPAKAPGAARLTAEQVKPYRQRLFRLMNDHLEPNGLRQEEGLGRADQMRMLAGIMFPEVTSLNELTEAQWEKYLQSLETKVQNDGAPAAVKYIRETIGV
jgi:hypothetical protein